MRDSHLLRRRLQQRLPDPRLPIRSRAQLVRKPSATVWRRPLQQLAAHPRHPRPFSKLLRPNQYHRIPILTQPPTQANGANYVIAIDGNFSLVYGTSASSPTTGSILTLINQARYNAGKSSIGFINPVLYAHPGILNDITEGGNQGCGTPGFSSAPGWDPVTGLGTPNYPKMLKLWLSLP